MSRPHHLQTSQDNESLDIHVKTPNCSLGNLILTTDFQDVVGTTKAGNYSTAITKQHKLVQPLGTS